MGSGKDTLPKTTCRFSSPSTDREYSCCVMPGGNESKYRRTLLLRKTPLLSFSMSSRTRSVARSVKSSKERGICVPCGGSCIFTTPWIPPQLVTRLWTSMSMRPASNAKLPTDASRMSMASRTILLAVRRMDLKRLCSGSPKLPILKRCSGSPGVTPSHLILSSTLIKLKKSRNLTCSF